MKHIKKNVANLESSSVVVAIVGKSPGAWNDVWAATDKLISANWCVDQVHRRNYGFAIVASESVVAIFLEAAPCTCCAFGLLWSPNFVAIQSKCLMGSATVPGTWAWNARAFAKTTFNWRIQIARLTGTVAWIAIIAATGATSVVACGTIWISLLCQRTARINSARCTVAGARVTWQVQVAFEFVATAFVTFAFWVRIVSLRWKIVQTLFDIGCATIAIVSWASRNSRFGLLFAQLHYFLIFTLSAPYRSVAVVELRSVCYRLLISSCHDLYRHRNAH